MSYSAGAVVVGDIVVVEVVVVTVVLVIEVVTAIVSGLSLAILSKIRAALIITTTNKFAVLIRHHPSRCVQSRPSRR